MIKHKQNKQRQYLFTLIFSVFVLFAAFIPKISLAQITASSINVYAISSGNCRSYSSTRYTTEGDYRYSYKNVYTNLGSYTSTDHTRCRLKHVTYKTRLGLTAAAKKRIAREKAAKAAAQRAAEARKKAAQEEAERSRILAAKNATAKKFAAPSFDSKSGYSKAGLSRVSASKCNSYYSKDKRNYYYAKKNAAGECYLQHYIKNSTTSSAKANNTKNTAPSFPAKTGYKKLSVTKVASNKCNSYTTKDGRNYYEAKKNSQGTCYLQHYLKQPTAQERLLNSVGALVPSFPDKAGFKKLSASKVSDNKCNNSSSSDGRNIYVATRNNAGQCYVQHYLKNDSQGASNAKDARPSFPDRAGYKKLGITRVANSKCTTYTAKDGRNYYEAKKNDAGVCYLQHYLKQNSNQGLVSTVGSAGKNLLGSLGVGRPSFSEKSGYRKLGVAAVGDDKCKSYTTSDKRNSYVAKKDSSGKCYLQHYIIIEATASNNSNCGWNVFCSAGTWISDNVLGEKAKDDQSKRDYYVTLQGAKATTEEKCKALTGTAKKNCQNQLKQLENKIRASAGEELIDQNTINRRIETQQKAKVKVIGERLALANDVGGKLASISNKLDSYRTELDKLKAKSNKGGLTKAEIERYNFLARKFNAEYDDYQKILKSKEGREYVAYTKMKTADGKSLLETDSNSYSSLIKLYKIKDGELVAKSDVGVGLMKRGTKDAEEAKAEMRNQFGYWDPEQKGVWGTLQNIGRNSLNAVMTPWTLAQVGDKTIDGLLKGQKLSDAFGYASKTNSPGKSAGEMGSFLMESLSFGQKVVQTGAHSLGSGIGELYAGASNFITGGSNRQLKSQLKDQQNELADAKAHLATAKDAEARKRWQAIIDGINRRITSTNNALKLEESKPKENVFVRTGKAMYSGGQDSWKYGTDYASLYGKTNKEMGQFFAQNPAYGIGLSLITDPLNLLVGEGAGVALMSKAKNMGAVVETIEVSSKALRGGEASLQGVATAIKEASAEGKTVSVLMQKTTGISGRISGVFGFKNATKELLVLPQGLAKEARTALLEGIENGTIKSVGQARKAMAKAAGVKVSDIVAAEKTATRTIFKEASENGLKTGLEDAQKAVDEAVNLGDKAKIAEAQSNLKKAKSLYLAAKDYSSASFLEKTGLKAQRAWNFAFGTAGARTSQVASKSNVDKKLASLGKTVDENMATAVAAGKKVNEARAAGATEEEIARLEKIASDADAKLSKAQKEVSAYEYKIANETAAKKKYSEALDAIKTVKTELDDVVNDIAKQTKARDLASEELAALKAEKPSKGASASERAKYNKQLSTASEKVRTEGENLNKLKTNQSRLQGQLEGLDKIVAEGKPAGFVSRSVTAVKSAAINARGGIGRLYSNTLDGIANFAKINNESSMARRIWNGFGKILADESGFVAVDLINPSVLLGQGEKAAGAKSLATRLSDAKQFFGKGNSTVGGKSVLTTVDHSSLVTDVSLAMKQESSSSKTLEGLRKLTGVEVAPGTNSKLLYLEHDLTKVSWVGDVHGDFESLAKVVAESGILDDPDRVIVFLGDYMDRGPNDIETLQAILKLKKEKPNQVVLLRGNHEDEAINLAYGAVDSFSGTYGAESEALMKQLYRLYEDMPVSIVIDDINGGGRAFGVHGFTPNMNDGKISFSELVNPNELLSRQLTWLDPNTEMDDVFRSSSRGSSFGHLTTKTELVNFLDHNNITYVARGHDYAPNVNAGGVGVLERYAGILGKDARGNERKVFNIFSATTKDVGGYGISEPGVAQILGKPKAGNSVGGVSVVVEEMGAKIVDTAKDIISPQAHSFDPGASSRYGGLEELASYLRNVNHVPLSDGRVMNGQEIASVIDRITVNVHSGLYDNDISLLTDDLKYITRNNGLRDQVNSIVVKMLGERKMGISVGSSPVINSSVIHEFSEQTVANVEHLDDLATKLRSTEKIALSSGQSVSGSRLADNLDLIIERLQQGEYDKFPILLDQDLTGITRNYGLRERVSKLAQEVIAARRSGNVPKFDFPVINMSDEKLPVFSMPEYLIDYVRSIKEISLSDGSIVSGSEIAKHIEEIIKNARNGMYAQNPVLLESDLIRITRNKNLRENVRAWVYVVNSKIGFNSLPRLAKMPNELPSFANMEDLALYFESINNIELSGGRSTSGLDMAERIRYINERAKLGEYAENPQRLQFDLGRLITGTNGLRDRVSSLLGKVEIQIPFESNPIKGVLRNEAGLIGSGNYVGQVEVDLVFNGASKVSSRFGWFKQSLRDIVSVKKPPRREFFIDAGDPSEALFFDVSIDGEKITTVHREDGFLVLDNVGTPIKNALHEEKGHIIATSQDELQRLQEYLIPFITQDPELRQIPLKVKTLFSGVKEGQAAKGITIYTENADDLAKALNRIDEYLYKVGLGIDKFEDGGNLDRVFGKSNRIGISRDRWEVDIASGVEERVIHDVTVREGNAAKIDKELQKLIEKRYGKGQKLTPEQLQQFAKDIDIDEDILAYNKDGEMIFKIGYKQSYTINSEGKPMIYLAEGGAGSRRSRPAMYKIYDAFDMDPAVAVTSKDVAKLQKPAGEGFFGRIIKSLFVARPKNVKITTNQFVSNNLHMLDTEGLITAVKNGEAPMAVLTDGKLDSDLVSGLERKLFTYKVGDEEKKALVVYRTGEQQEEVDRVIELITKVRASELSRADFYNEYGRLLGYNEKAIQKLINGDKPSRYYSYDEVVKIGQEKKVSVSTQAKQDVKGVADTASSDVKAAQTEVERLEAKATELEGKNAPVEEVEKIQAELHEANRVLEAAKTDEVVVSSGEKVGVWQKFNNTISDLRSSLAKSKAARATDRAGRAERIATLKGELSTVEASLTRINDRINELTEEGRQLLKGTSPKVVEGIESAKARVSKFFTDVDISKYQNTAIGQVVLKKQESYEQIDRAISILQSDAAGSARAFGAEGSSKVIHLQTDLDKVHWVGDLHGDYNALVQTVAESGIMIDPEKVIVFLGDYVDTGSMDITTLQSLLRLKERYPNQVYMLRGNHEDFVTRMSRQTTKINISGVYGEDAIMVHNNLFENLPLGIVIDDTKGAGRAFGVHGFTPISRDGRLSLSEIAQADRDLQNQLLWLDPVAENGIGRSGDRGLGFGQVSKEQLSNFLDTNGITYVVRGHDQSVNEVVRSSVVSRFEGSIGVDGNGIQRRVYNVFNNSTDYTIGTPSSLKMFERTDSKYLDKILSTIKDEMDRSLEIRAGLNKKRLEFKQQLSAERRQSFFAGVKGFFGDMTDAFAGKLSHGTEGAIDVEKVASDTDVVSSTVATVTKVSELERKSLLQNISNFVYAKYLKGRKLKVIEAKKVAIDKQILAIEDLAKAEGIDLSKALDIEAIVKAEGYEDVLAAIKAAGFESRSEALKAISEVIEAKKANMPIISLPAEREGYTRIFFAASDGQVARMIDRGNGVFKGSESAKITRFNPDDPFAGLLTEKNIVMAEIPTDKMPEYFKVVDGKIVFAQRTKETIPAEFLTLLENTYNEKALRYQNLSDDLRKALIVESHQMSMETAEKLASELKALPETPSLAKFAGSQYLASLKNTYLSDNFLRNFFFGRLSYRMLYPALFGGGVIIGDQIHSDISKIGTPSSSNLDLPAVVPTTHPTTKTDQIKNGLAVSAFQKAYNGVRCTGKIPVDGVYGPLTRSALVVVSGNRAPENSDLLSATTKLAGEEKPNCGTGREEVPPRDPAGSLPGTSGNPVEDLTGVAGKEKDTKPEEKVVPATEGKTVKDVKCGLLYTTKEAASGQTYYEVCRIIAPVYTGSANAMQNSSILKIFTMKDGKVLPNAKVHLELIAGDQFGIAYNTMDQVSDKKGRLEYRLFGLKEGEYGFNVIVNDEVLPTKFVVTFKNNPTNSLQNFWEYLGLRAMNTIVNPFGLFRLS